MAEPHTLTFLFTKRRITGGQAVRHGRGSARSGRLPPGAQRAGSAGTILQCAAPRLEEAKWGAALAEEATLEVAYALEDAARS